MEKRCQIFISSTYEDLKNEREEIIKAVLEMGHIPVGMEMFNAADEDQWRIIQRTIDSSDYYVVISAHRYGSIFPGADISFTEMEYDYARSIGLPCIGFVIDGKAAWPAQYTDKGKSYKLLEEFKRKIRAKPVDFWTTKEDLKSKFAIAMLKTFNIQPRVGWVRGDSISSKETLESLAASVKENIDLRERLANIGQIGSPRSRAMYSRLKGMGEVWLEYKYQENRGEIGVEAIKVFRVVADILALRKMNVADLDNAAISAFLSDEHTTYMEIEVPIPTPGIVIAGLFYKRVPFYIKEFRRLGIITGDTNVALTENGIDLWDYLVNMN